MFPCQFYKKWVSARERNIKLLLESVTYIVLQKQWPAFYNRNCCALQKVPPA